MLKIIENIDQWQAERKNISSTLSIGFVPTMGNLHEGHMSLMRRSISENQITIVSIFVNPIQFNNKDDFKNYPQTLVEDKAMLQDARVNYLLLPTYEQLYPDDAQFKLYESNISKLLEGKHRPGHFEGVLTVIMKLFMLVKPNRAYFGEKDYQQFQLVKAMSKAFFMDVEIIGCPTIRNEFGLPLSSRNNRLSQEQLEKSRAFPKFLNTTMSCQEIINALNQAGFIVEYVEEKEGRRFAAIKLGSVRLIDNIALAELES